MFLSSFNFPCSYESFFWFFFLGLEGAKIQKGEAQPKERKRRGQARRLEVGVGPSWGRCWLSSLGWGCPALCGFHQNFNYNHTKENPRVGGNKTRIGPWGWGWPFLVGWPFPGKRLVRLFFADDETCHSQSRTRKTAPRGMWPGLHDAPDKRGGTCGTRQP